MISAPSGTGKTSVIKGVRERVNGLGYSVSHTTRRPRPNEKQGIDYYFVDKRQFEAMVEQGGFVEWAEVYGELYGTSYSSIEAVLGQEKDVVLDVDPKGAKNLRARYPDRCVLIYLLPPDVETLQQRLKGRGTDEEGVIRARLSQVARELKECLSYDYVVINQELDTAVEEVCAIIKAERLRSHRMAPVVKERFGNNPSLET